MQCNETAEYYWCTNDGDTVLGRGAYGAVYEGFHKETGKHVAVKEIDTTKFRKEEYKLVADMNHENIVKLFGGDKTASGSICLFMELCNGGNYHDYLKLNKNMNGIEEADFLIVLKDMTSAMRYLRGLKIIHRDVKPGNIMRCINHDGRICCKLTDFGAARKLDDDQNFGSIYGTKEYLAPAMFMALQYRTDQRENCFDANIDLWSLGSTFHHLACGQVPFRLFGGMRTYDASEERKLNDVVIQMFNERPPKILGGYQPQEGGEFLWQYKFPSISPISRSLREEVEALLKRIFDVDPDRRLNFATYFKFVDYLFQMAEIHVFCVPSSKYFKIFFPAKASWRDLQVKMEEYFSIPPQSQQFIYRGDKLAMEEMTPVGELPALTSDRPLILMSCEPQDPRPFTIPPTSKPPPIVRSGNPAIDIKLPQVCSGSLWSMKRTVEYITHCSHLTGLALQWYKLYFQSELIRTQNTFHRHMVKMDASRSKIVSMTSQSQEVEGADVVDPALDNCKLKFEELEDCYATARDKFVEMSRLKTEEISDDCNRQKASDWIESFLSYSQSCDKVSSFMKKYHKSSFLNGTIYNDRYKPNMFAAELEKLANICFEAVNKFRKDFRLTYQGIHLEAGKTFRSMQEQIEQLQQLERHLSVDLLNSLEKLQEDLSKI